MADPYGNEEEQIRALKQWWADNGTSTIAGVVLAVAIVFGWKWWEAREATRAAQAAGMYQQLQAAISSAATDEVQRATAEHLANELATQHDGEQYGDYGRLMLARLRVEADDLDAAERELRTVIDASADAAIVDLASLRLARLLNAQGKADEALGVLDPNNGFTAEMLTLRGDILRGRNDREGALAAYRAAAAESGMGEKPAGILGLKIQELEVWPDDQPLPPVAGQILSGDSSSAGEDETTAGGSDTVDIDEQPVDATVIVDAEVPAQDVPENATGEQDNE